MDGMGDDMSPTSNFDVEKKRFHFSKKSPTGPTERTPKPEYLMGVATYLGARW